MQSIILFSMICMTSLKDILLILKNFYVISYFIDSKISKCEERLENCDFFSSSAKLIKEKSHYNIIEKTRAITDY